MIRFFFFLFMFSQDEIVMVMVHRAIQIHVESPPNNVASQFCEFYKLKVFPLNTTLVIHSHIRSYIYDFFIIVSCSTSDFLNFLVYLVYFYLFFFPSLCHAVLYCSHVDPISSSPCLNAMPCLYSFGLFSSQQKYPFPLFSQKTLMYPSRFSSSVISSVMASMSSAKAR